MRHMASGGIAGVVGWLTAALLLAVMLPPAPAAAASGPSLSYSVMPQAYNNTVRIGPSGLLDSPRVAVGPDRGNLSREDVYVIGLNSTQASGPNATACSYLVVIKSTDAGRSFGAPKDGNVCVPKSRVDAVVLPDGIVVASVGARILRSTDGGATWTPKVVLNTTVIFASLAFDAVTGELHLVGTVSSSLEVATSGDGGATWGRPSTIPVQAFGFAPQIAARAGRIVVTLNDLASARSGSVVVPAFVTSSNGGATWSREALLADPTNATMYHASPVSATVSAGGVFALVWYESADKPSWHNATMAALSRDGGSTWSPPITVGEIPNLFSDFLPNIAVFDSESRLFVAWHNYSADLTQDFLTVSSSDRALDTFNASAFSINFESTSAFNATTAGNLAADNASRVFLMWLINGGTNPSAPDVGVFVRTVTGAAMGDVRADATAAATSATVTVRSTSAGGPVRQVAWTGQAFLLPELPPDEYQVWIDSGNGSALAGAMPVLPWGQTSFVVHVAGVNTGPPPPAGPPFPWIVLEVLAGGVIVLGAALVTLHYTRLTRETVLQQKVRLVLNEYIREHPGASFSAVRDAFGLQNGAAAYHLTVLEKQGFLHSEMKGRRHFYYPNGNAALWKDLPLSELQNAILQAIRAAPGIGLRELGRCIGREPSSVGYNVRALAREGLLRTVRDGLRLRCYPAEPNASG